ncbi:hypothetical protein IQ249_13310 [Lusitaniella coriacea LEGE 07157]|uniref:Haloacid dehalogenase-like hydrolase n=1 Tax=Lusitaniella coriacea LEGE 07157 TaxID=945747 RepID=A0A8J7E041_9CYAN|nr:hypothetical protein [Lusitaniella coriacea]MBE9116879.1 hypothetical protein [Lusitaniella coriacea LEGE 07157]
MNRVDRIIGVDFDNTIVSYDELMHELAVQHGWIDRETQKSKKVIRDSIRKLPDGDVEWQKLQALAYGCKMEKAHLIDGVKDFFQYCKQNNITTYIVSHKTEYANFDETQTNLREAALNWMQQNKFFEKEELGLSRDRVFFESTRTDKIERVKTLSCESFIDDLEETFQETSFPTHIQKILYDPHQQYIPKTDVTIINSWKEVNEYFFSTSL